ncbi:MAG: TerC family protein [Bacteroidia bacterium]
METGTIFWVVFGILIITTLAIDLGVFSRNPHQVSVKEALIWSGIWISIAIGFNAGIYFYMGREPAMQFLTGYLLEKSLSVDNIFVFFMLFTYFKLNAEYQHKVLFWGVLGAIIFRGIMIVVGANLIKEFHWSIYFLSVFLIYTGVKMVLGKEAQIEPEKNIAVRLLKKLLPVSGQYHGDKFFILINNVTHATLLFIALVSVEMTDIVFAIDSVPAILAITQNTFIVFTSNIFAIMGLRSLYFALTGMMGKLRFLKIGLSVILIYIGIKMFLHDIYKIRTDISLMVIFAGLFFSIMASILFPETKKT